MAKVVRQDNESIERQISRFRRVVLRSGKLKQVRSTRFFKKAATPKMIKKNAHYRSQKREALLEG